MVARDREAGDSEVEKKGGKRIVVALGFSTILYRDLTVPHIDKLLLPLMKQVRHSVTVIVCESTAPRTGQVILLVFFLKGEEGHAMRARAQQKKSLNRLSLKTLVAVGDHLRRARCETV